MKTIPDIRPSPIAGTWYSDDAQQLTRQIDGYLSTAQSDDIRGKVFGLIAPHAGHRYSGPTAGFAYRLVLGKSYDLVVILSPAHAYYPASILSTAHKSYATPLGEIPIHPGALGIFEENMKAARMDFARVANDEEHSIEIQLPFLQRSLADNFSLLPIMMRSQDTTAVEAVARSLVPILQEYKSLVIASSDLSHFYPQDFANSLDEHLLQMVADFSPEGVLKAEEEGSGFACGAGPIAAVLVAAKQVGANRVKVLHYSTSADVTGDQSSVVGYGSAVVYYPE